jgi:hypothetical protein
MRVPDIRRRAATPVKPADNFAVKVNEIEALAGVLGL